MTPEFLQTVLDTLLPAERAVVPGPAALPSGSAAGVDLASYRRSARPVLDAIARAAGGASAFVSAAEAARIEVLKAVDHEMPEAFRALIEQLVADYCESSQVLTAFGWRPDPPQPQGHPLASIDAATEQRLERVRQRGKIWRG